MEQNSRNSNFCLMSFSIIRNGSVNLSSTSKCNKRTQLICGYIVTHCLQKDVLLNSIDIHTIAAIQTAENYTNLAKAFRDVFCAINSYMHNH